MSDHVLGAAPELATLRLLDHAIDTTLDLLTALYPQPFDRARRDHVRDRVGSLVVALREVRDLADDYVLAVRNDLTSTDHDTERDDDNDLF